MQGVAAGHIPTPHVSQNACAKPHTMPLKNQHIDTAARPVETFGAASFQKHLGKRKVKAARNAQNRS
jgi:hypothetical protein